MNKENICFIHIKPIKFSGQAEATNIIAENLKETDYHKIFLKIPTFNNYISFYKAVFFLIRDFIFLYLRPLLIVFKNPSTYLSLGQSFASMIRVFFPYIFLCSFTFNKTSIISLHGSVFMDWRKNSINGLLLRLYIFYSNYITVLGPTQKEKLIKLGINPKKIKIVPNTTLTPKIGLEEIKKKHRENVDEIQILFLASLIDTKGYPEYLEAIKKISEEADHTIKIKAILCGPLVMNKYNRRFQTLDDAENWIKMTIVEINKSQNIKAEWVRGARGEEKFKLFNTSHIFVFPSKYAVEAQPIVLLEAMATGCAIITSGIGEIPFTMEKTGVLIKDPDTDMIKDTILELTRNTSLRLKIAKDQYQLFLNKYDIEQHMSYWKELFSKRR